MGLEINKNYKFNHVPMKAQQKTVSEEMTNHAKMSVIHETTDSFEENQADVKLMTSYGYLQAYAVRDKLNIANKILDQVDYHIKAYFDGTISEIELEDNYKSLAKEYIHIFDNESQSIFPADIQRQQAAAENFYDMFRQQILSVAVQRNQEEGMRYVTGEINAQRSWKYYNSDYYFMSEDAITVITEGAKDIAQGQGISFNIPDYKKQGLNLYHNFNTAWSNNFDLNEQYIFDSDMIPPERFKWFFEQGGTSNYDTVGPTSLTVYHIDGTKSVFNYKTSDFEPTDPMKANTWASHTDVEGIDHFISRDFLFYFTENDLYMTSDLLSFSAQDVKHADILNRFLSNLQVYSKNHFTRIQKWNDGADFRA